MYPLTHVGTFNTRWHLDKKTGGIPTKSGHTPKWTETEFLHKLGFSN